MRAPDPGRLRALLVSSAALVAVLITAVLVPATSSAFTASVTNTTDTAAAKSRFLCGDTFAGERRRSSAYFEFGLTEAADATTAVDSSDAGDVGAYLGSNAKDAAPPIACSGDGGGAYLLDGSTSRISTGRRYPPILGTFSEEVWFKTTSGGKLLGFEAAQDGQSSNYDKHLYIGGSGHLVFGIFNGQTQTLSTPGRVDDGLWHYAVATTSASGSVLYLDGVRVAADSGITTAEDYAGYWRLGSGALGGWPDQPASIWFAGSLRFAAAYPVVLTADEVASAWSIGRPGGAVPTPTPTPMPTPTPTPSPAPTTDPSPAATPAPTTSATPTATNAPGPTPDNTASTETAPPDLPPDISTTPDGPAPSG